MMAEGYGKLQDHKIQPAQGKHFQGERHSPRCCAKNQRGLSLVSKRLYSSWWWKAILVHLHDKQYNYGNEED